MHTPGEAPVRPQGFWPWLLQRVSGVALIFLVGLHIWVTHFADIGKVVAGQQEELVLFHLVRLRLQSLVFLLVDGALLGLALFHGLNGLRGVLLEWRPLAPHRRWVTLGLWGVGLVAFVYGLMALWAFVR
ncbi:MAG: hypothetical protein NZ951_04730 [Dehalococcoidia bacterium]|nr:hypothetical protein [Dehalococcoidia bacterium]MDW8120311.1 hypothetical protein [Chloroflexota bacterium]